MISYYCPCIEVFALSGSLGGGSAFLENRCG
jgi:hypothetical protein